MDNEYSLESETQYDEYSKFLLIRITISIPDRLMPKDIETGSEIIIEQIKLFRTFYEAQNEIFKKNTGTI